MCVLSYYKIILYYLYYYHCFSHNTWEYVCIFFFKCFITAGKQTITLYFVRCLSYCLFNGFNMLLLLRLSFFLFDFIWVKSVLISLCFICHKFLKRPLFIILIFRFTQILFGKPSKRLWEMPRFLLYIFIIDNKQVS